MRELIFTPHKCSRSRCGKEFEGPGKPVPGMIMYCKECTKLMMRIRDLERELISQEFSLEKKDEEIARQIHKILLRERSGITKKDEELLTSLTERMLKDEKRRKKILKQIKKLQKDKR